MATAQKSRLQKYIFTHGQLQTYLQIFAEDNDIVVLTDSQPATHVPSKVVGLPIGTPHAATSASHEALHIRESQHEAMAAMRNSAERAILNVLEDARIERKSFRTKPGLRPQFQEDIDDLTNIILKEGWLSQALKAFYLQGVGYAFPYDKLHPKAQTALARFQVFIPQVRKAETEKDLVPLVPKVLALFDERIEMPEPPQPRPEPGQNPFGDEDEDEDEDPFGDDEGEDEGDILPRGEGANDGEGERDEQAEGAESPTATKKPGKTPGKGIGGKDPGAALKGADDQYKEPSPAEKSLAERMREGMKDRESQANKVRRAHGAVNVSEDEDESDEYDDESVIEREGITYDADEARSRSEAARRLGDTGEAPPKRGRENVRGGDRVTGGPSVNQLMLQADKVKKDLDALEAKRKRNALSALTRAQRDGRDTGYEPGAGYVPYVPPAVDEERENGVSTARLPKKMAAIANMHKDIEKGTGKRNPYDYAPTKSVTLDIDWNALLGDEHGGTGYRGGRGWNVQDMRGATGYAAEAEASAKRFMPTSNYLARQLRVFMQTDARNGYRAYERMGILDSRRSFHMGGGRFDVFKYPPNASTSEPVVVMTTDMSGSMASYGSRTTGHCFHAMNSTIVLAQALSRLHIPFESHGFSHTGYLFKAFTDPWNHRALQGVAQTLGANGGTSAAEALAVAWARALSRPEKRKIVFVLTDGGVANNTRDMAEAIEKAGGIVVGVGIGLGYIKSYFPHYVEVSNAAELPAVFARLLRKLLPTGEWAQ